MAEKFICNRVGIWPRNDCCQNSEINHTCPILFTLISSERSGVFTKPIARASNSPHVGGFSALVVDHTPAGDFIKGPGVIPQPDIFKLKCIKVVQLKCLNKYVLAINV